MQPTEPLRLAVLLSGSGRTLENLAQGIREGTLPVRIVTVISSNPQAYGLVRARNLGLPAHVVPRKAFADTSSFSQAIWPLVRQSQAQLVCLAGFLSLLEIPEDYWGKVVNIHPALLPAFGGKGMYGHRVHEAVLAAGCKVSGCTVHFCDQLYDHGPIIIQKTCPVLEDDTSDTLAARVFELECQAYPEAIRLIAEGRVRIEGCRCRILPPKSAP